jgi:hypothetical protein
VIVKVRSPSKKNKIIKRLSLKKKKKAEFAPKVYSLITTSNSPQPSSSISKGGFFITVLINYFKSLVVRNIKEDPE